MFEFRRKSFWCTVCLRQRAWWRERPAAWHKQADGHNANCPPDAAWAKDQVEVTYRMFDILFPELVDHIFQYLDDQDFYACLFVSRQFNENAIRLLYSDLRFDADFTDYASNEEQKFQVAARLGDAYRGRNIDRRNCFGTACTRDLLSPCTYATLLSARCTKTNEPWVFLFPKEYTSFFVMLPISATSDTSLLTMNRRRTTAFDSWELA